MSKKQKKGRLTTPDGKKTSRLGPKSFIDRLHLAPPHVEPDYGGPRAATLMHDARSEAEGILEAAAAKASAVLAEAERKAGMVRDLADEEHRRAKARIETSRPEKGPGAAPAAEKVEAAAQHVIRYLSTAGTLCTRQELAAPHVTIDALDAALDELLATRRIGAAAIAAGKGVRYWAN